MDSSSPDSGTSRPSTHRVRAVESSTAQCSPTDVICTSWSSSTGGSCHLAATVTSSAASTRATAPVLGVYAKSTPAGSTEVTAPGPKLSTGSASPSKSANPAAGAVHTLPSAATTTRSPARAREESSGGTGTVSMTVDVVASTMPTLARSRSSTSTVDPCCTISAPEPPVSMTELSSSTAVFARPTACSSSFATQTAASPRSTRWAA